MTEEVLETGQPPVEGEDQRPLPVLYHGDVSAEPPALLARLSESKAVRIVADRLALTDRSKTPITHSEALLIAQAAIATGLSPFQPQPELWYWIKEKQGRRYLTLMRGRDGTTRLAHENARRDGTYLEEPRYELITDEKRKVALGFNPDDLVVRARVANHREVSEWYKRREMLRKEGLSAEEIDRRVGSEEPASEGYGRITRDEMAKLDKYEDNKMPHINRARKRARIEAEKPWAAQIDIAALAENAPADLDAYVIDAEWKEVEPPDPDTLKKRAFAGAAALYGEPPSYGNGPHEPLPPEPERSAEPAGAGPVLKVREPEKVREAFLKTVTSYKGTRRNEDLAKKAGWMMRETFGGDDDARHACQMFLLGKPSLTDFTGAELKAVLTMLKSQKGPDGKWHPNPIRAEEFRGCARALQEEGAANE